MVVTKKQKEQFCESFFNNNVEPKYLKDFETITPKGNIISGVICQKTNEFLGSMVITFVKTESNEFNTLQFVHAMPEVCYYNKDNELYHDSVIKTYYAYEKLDGDCIIMYPLYDNINQLIEVIPKTRDLPVADEHTLNMLKLIDTTNIDLFFKKETKCILLFELYGVLNKNNIFYSDCYIDIRLLGVIYKNKLMTDYETDCMALIYDFKRPQKLFECVFYKNHWFFTLVADAHPFSTYLNDIIGDKPSYYSQQLDMVEGLKKVLMDLNNNFFDKNERLFIEGIVIYGLDANKNPCFLKVES